MGLFNPDQIALLVGIYILDTLCRVLNLDNNGIYRDDGLTSIPNSNRPLISKVQKKVIRVFRFIGLKIEISSNLKKIVNFLDVTQFK